MTASFTYQDNSILPHVSGSFKYNFGYSAGGELLSAYSTPSCSLPQSFSLAVPSNADLIPCVGQVSGQLNPSLRTHAGLDWLELSLWVEWPDDSPLVSCLRLLKQEFEDENLGLQHLRERPVSFLSGYEFNLFRHGRGEFPWVLQSGDLTFFVSSHHYTAPHPNFRFLLTSKSCWNPGWKRMYLLALAFISVYGGKVKRETVSRVDLASDIINCDFTKTGFINKDRWICRGEDCNPVYNKYIPTYISFGKGQHMLRCYDKTGELLDDPVKKQFFESYWQEVFGFVPEHVTRVEHQVRRVTLQRLGIKTVADLEKNLNALWQYCVGSPDQSLDVSEKEYGWSRFLVNSMTEDDRANKNHDHYATDDLWKLVQSATFNSEVFKKLNRVKKEKPFFNFEATKSRIRGAIVSCAAGLGLDSEFRQLRSFAIDLVAEVFDDLAISFRRFPEKIKEFEAKFKAKVNQYRPFYHDDFETCHDYGIDPLAHILNPSFSYECSTV